MDIACIAQSVNVIAPIRTEADGTSWKQSIYYPFELTSRFGRGMSLKIDEENNDKQALYGSAVWNEQRNELALFITNRSEEVCDFSCQLPSVSSIKKSVTMYCHDHKAINGPNCEKIAPQLLTATLDKNAIKAELSPVSWSMIVVQF